MHCFCADIAARLRLCLLLRFAILIGTMLNATTLIASYYADCATMLIATTLIGTPTPIDTRLTATTLINTTHPRTPHSSTCAPICQSVHPSAYSFSSIQLSSFLKSYYVTHKHPVKGFFSDIYQPASQPATHIHPSISTQTYPSTRTFLCIHP